MRWIFIVILVISTVTTLAPAIASNSQPPGIQSVAVSVADLGNPFFIRIAESVRERVRAELGTQVRVTVKSNAYDTNRLNRQIEEFIAQDVDLIILVASDADAIEPGIRQAQRDGIKVVAVDVNARGADATITTDNVQAGEVACDYIARRLEGEGQVVIINGPPVSSVHERVAGCKSVLNNYPNLQLLSDELSGGGSAEGGMEAMAQLLESYPDLDAVFAINDPTASGAKLIAEQSGRTHFFIVSVDGGPRMVRELQTDPQVWVASAAQFPREMAYQAVDIGIRLIRGEHISQSTRLIPTQLISAKNVNNYEGWD